MKHRVLLQSGRLFLLIFNIVGRSYIILNDMHLVLLPKNSWYIEEQISLQTVEGLNFMNITDKQK